MDLGETLPAHVPPELVFDFDMYADARLRPDIQAAYAEAVRAAPDIFWSRRNGGHWMVKSFEAISAIQRDYEHFTVREQQIPRVPNPPVFIPLSLDPPANIPYRQILMPMFSPRSVAGLEPKIRDWARRIIAEVADAGACDFARDVSTLFPVSIFMEMMGMPLERLREFRERSDDYFRATNPTDKQAGIAEILRILKELIAERRESLGDDFMSHLITVETEGRNLNPDEVLAMCFILFLGGMDTVTNVTSFAYQFLAGRPDLQARLASDPALIPKFVEEAIRCFAVVNSPRMVAKDCERFGVAFKAGDMVLSLLPAASFGDERANDDPLRFNLERANPAYLAFSIGPHLCVGHNLARAEIRILTEEWLKRIPRFTAAGDQPRGFRAGTVMALETLPLAW